ncbi:hypothetical protein KM043_003540 [Ampulex compressa]|nr:hypothetical protein KM043_003540 [Ampulex compressa]
MLTIPTPHSSNAPPRSSLHAQTFPSPNIHTKDQSKATSHVGQEFYHELDAPPRSDHHSSFRSFDEDPHCTLRHFCPVDMEDNPCPGARSGSGPRSWVRSSGGHRVDIPEIASLFMDIVVHRYAGPATVRGHFLVP